MLSTVLNYSCLLKFFSTLVALVIALPLFESQSHGHQSVSLLASLIAVMLTLECIMCNAKCEQSYVVFIQMHKSSY